MFNKAVQLQRNKGLVRRRTRWLCESECREDNVDCFAILFICIIYGYIRINDICKLL